MFIAFDLDGTLADPSEGVTNGINHTLRRLGRPERPPGELLKYIGPPTEWIFGDVLNTSDRELVEEARTIFTEFYRTDGYRQNVLYPGTLQMIETLTQSGHYLVVVTSKSESGAKAAAKHFRLNEYFKGVFGRINNCNKVDSLKQALSTTSIRPAAMIGDRKFDIAAGKVCGCTTIGVTYGFGTSDELRLASPDHLVQTQNEIPALIEKIAETVAINCSVKISST